MLMELNKRTTSFVESLVTRREGNIKSYIQNVMALVKECGATIGTKEHFTTSLIFTKKNERKMFMTLDNPKERFQWLQMKTEWMHRNNVCM